jgi:hypothetical protein
MRAWNPVRRGQLIAPFGVAAMMVLKGGMSVITAGLDHWFEREDGDSKGIDLNEFRVQEWRLERLLKVTHFRQPPDFRTGRRDIPNAGLKIPFLRFPQWHQCPLCNRLSEQPLSLREHVRCPECERKNRRKHLIQVPIVAICDAGHIQDFPWHSWVHRAIQPACDRSLRLIATGGATLAAQKVACDCGVERTLAGITEASNNSTFLTSNLDRNNLYTCRGKRVWLGSSETAPCNCPIRGSLRSASNVYFADVHSAIYLPRGDGALAELLALFAEPPLSTILDMVIAAGAQPSAQQLRAVQGALLQSFNDTEIDRAIEIMISGMEDDGSERVETDDPSTAFRRPEHAVLRTERDDTDLIVRPADLAKYDLDIAKSFSAIGLIHKLRETRAFAGFTRIFPYNQQSLAERKALLWRQLPPADEWLPASVVFGEGIFLELEEERVRTWESQPAVIERGNRLRSIYQQLQQGRRFSPRPISPRFLLLHTLAHVIMNRLTFECGYSSAALRERLYVSDDLRNPMAGVLIYTAAGDAEGTMGGLVRMGKPGYLEPVLRRALESASWCSADPVCMEMGATSGQGPDSCNLSACHNCALVPETACEQFNRFLDRAALIGTPSQPNVGFFIQ